jgi:signal transduction histidine kinase
VKYWASHFLMPSPVIRARIAPVALLIALAFVIVGFLRADREMTHAELDRATLMASETGTLVEVFLLRQVTRLHSVERVAETYLQDSLRLADQLPRLPEDSTKLITADTPFDDLLAILPAARGRTVIPLDTRDGAFLGDSTLIERLAANHSGSEPGAVIDRNGGRRLLWLIEPIRGRPDAFVVAATSLDSLASLLARNKHPSAVGIVVTAAADTVVALSDAVPNKQSRSLQQPVATPFSDKWLVTMTYTPSSRSVRIALWIVGLGAIVGLGIGLLLERREASRIADRSSELEHLSAELLRANRAKSEFLANVSHELRTPLNAIVGFVDLLRDGVYGPLNSRQAGPVERIEASANHLRHLVDQVLDLAKIAAGRLEIHTEPVELRPFVFDVASEVEPLMTEKGLSFSLAVGASLPRVRTDPTHLRQILINLLGNAVKFTNDGGISVRGKLVKRTHQNGASPDLLAGASNSETLWIALQVADSGIGIPEKDRERIFDEFEQVNAGPRGDSMRRGTGLGLSISRRLARLLGGDLSVESELGRGSVFTIWLPVDPADVREDQAA